MHVFILSDINGVFRIVEAFINKKGFWSHNDSDVANGFENKETAAMYCNEFNYTIINK